MQLICAFVVHLSHDTAQIPLDIYICLIPNSLFQMDMLSTKGFVGILVMSGTILTVKVCCHLCTCICNKDLRKSVA